jgi:cyclic-di-AMP phosphodiesterase PgpH
VRVGAYYHDIGKLHAPEMFVENQRGGPNPHDRLDPFESARQIMRHVSYGVELAREAGLPPQVMEMITGHHGTRTLHVFLEKAKRLAPDGAPVDESPFRYPGPKPQTRESAILMLADGCEAAVRSLDDPSREQVDAIVGKIADAVVADHQFDECGITFEEVARVRAAIADTLVNLHHRRVKYPGFNPPAPQEEPKRV